MIVALIVAAGVGSRMVGITTPKQYLMLNGKPVINWSYEQFFNHSMIDKVVLVINKQHEAILKSSFYGQDVEYCYGGASRAESVKNGLNYIAQYSPSKVLIHDAARPLVSAKIISDVITSLSSSMAVDVGVKVHDTAKYQSDGQNYIIDRDHLYLTQTPQGFDFKYLTQDLLTTSESNTDEISLCIDRGHSFKVVPGSKENFKITTAEDLELAEFYARKYV